jgi:hypothetical protein
MVFLLLAFLPVVLLMTTFIPGRSPWWPNPVLGR